MVVQAHILDYIQHAQQKNYQTCPSENSLNIPHICPDPISIHTIIKQCIASSIIIRIQGRALRCGGWGARGDLRGAPGRERHKCGVHGGEGEGSCT
jgi:hypothetical protein